MVTSAHEISIDDDAFDKFKRHIVNLDSQPAMFLKTECKTIGCG